MLRVLTATLVLSFAPDVTQAQTDYQLAIDAVDGLWDSQSTTLVAGAPVTFYFRFTNPPSPNEANIVGYSTAFRVYSPDGATWGPITWVPYLEMLPDPHNVILYPLWSNLFDNFLFMNPFSITGSGADTIGFAGATKFGGGAYPGFSELVFTISTQVDASYYGKTLCIDSAWYPPSNKFIWACDTGEIGTIEPVWDGPYCYTIGQPDSDVDGIADADDNCPNSYNPRQEDADGDDIGDVCDDCTDSDSDGYGNPGYAASTCPEDNCPDNYNPVQTDTDGDDIGDACDPDDDNDGVPDASDTDPLDPTICQDLDADGCNDCSIGTDGFGPLADNLPGDDGLDTDADGLCDTGDPDDDNDGVADASDADPLDPLVCEDSDSDGCDDCSVGTDGFGPLADNLPFNDGTDTDADGLCDTGDPDDDNDGVADASDADPLDPLVCEDSDSDGCDDCSVGTDGLGPLADNDPNNDGPDADADGLCDSGDPCTDTDSDGYGNPGFPNLSCQEDNCPDVANPGQEDTNGDDIGDACCCLGIRGNANGDALENVNISDISYLVEYSFGAPELGPSPPCPNEGNANGDGLENINISDISYLVEYLFGVPELGPPPPSCP